MTFHRYVALGDSFTEGVGDPDPSRPNGLRGWADRVADVLAQQTEPAQRRLALDPRCDVVGQGADLVRRPEHELTGVQDERLVTLGLDLAGQVGLLDRGVDVRVLVVVEDPEETVQPDVDARRLDHRSVVGLDGDAVRFDFGEDVAV